ncbi:TPA: cysteine desulfurase NifS [Candidatus Campbellbacteria bacterium]|nr:MAG: cysteine desulfurase NifS, cysteine desulfurase [Candidatus Campbellbacteria bacterium GW2011_OD1_34_28]KKP74975.1 MAG: Cysteine desulfurase [Candidatus Campbellbacteria bacterium GW2011_GWD2_35_24]KKP75861.1 MAG: cysteine desulfurase NifS, cysteine desulfurase [Candidatus Campbellbacteria bacterium GW2011_GWC2_35_28]KKP76891.1 MAG: cysteine desulfurase NifS, cysteine desulfurase [Candidatus Campbellbacteria bacterium GW2011_GWC1_35_31]KKP78817.1 MAG: Cysteine desulfurase [Candidatus Ca
MFFKKKERRVFLDHATTTPVRKEVLKVMEPYWNEKFGNPGTIHRFGVEAKKALDESRKKISQILKCHSDEVIFTASGTESNSLAIFGFLDKQEENGADFKKMHIITTKMEHPSILAWFARFERKGIKVSYIDIDKEGIVDLKQFRKLLTPETIFVSVMCVNNEIGTVQPISKIAHIIKDFNRDNKAKIILHSDASQAPLYLKLDVHSLGVDMLTIDGQKIYGPKGVGALFKKRGIEINPLLAGGSQEMGLRAGTENIPLVVGLAKAFELAENEREKESERLIKLRDKFIDRILIEIPGSVLNGSKTERIPSNVNISIPNIDSEYMIIKLDAKGVACSSKSACMGRIKSASYVIEALGNDMGNSLRFNLGKSTTEKDIDYVVDMIKQSIK